jgi:hypothetical protein
LQAIAITRASRGALMGNSSHRFQHDEHRIARHRLPGRDLMLITVVGIGAASAVAPSPPLARRARSPRG